MLEFCDQSLENVIEESNFVLMEDIKKFTRGIFNGLKEMHSLGISHRDLKPENVLLKDKEVKIADVGSSKVVDTSPKHLNTPYVVSRYYRAPELILASNKYDPSIDIWATGCILFEMITKTAMFPGESEGLQLVEIQQILGAPSDAELQHYQEVMNVDQNVLKLFTKVTKMDNNKKLEILEMFKASNAHSKIYTEDDLKEASELIEQCLKWSPADRISAEEAL